MVQEPFLLIRGAVHHWDEYGVWENETRSGVPPEPVKKAQREEVKFVRAWMEQWNREKGNREGEGLRNGGDYFFV